MLDTMLVLTPFVLLMGMMAERRLQSSVVQRFTAVPVATGASRICEASPPSTARVASHARQGYFLRKIGGAK